MSPWPTVEALLLLVEVLLDLGDRAAATAHLERVRLLLGWSLDGAEVQLARLQRLEQRLARRSRTSSVAGPLTDRELVVLRLLRGSLPLREIARELDVSANTVKTHASAIYRKLAVSNARAPSPAATSWASCRSPARPRPRPGRPPPRRRSAGPPVRAPGGGAAAPGRPVRSAGAAGRGGPPHCGASRTASGRCSAGGS